MQHECKDHRSHPSNAEVYVFIFIFITSSHPIPKWRGDYAHRLLYRVTILWVNISTCHKFPQ